MNIREGNLYVTCIRGFGPEKPRHLVRGQPSAVASLAWVHGFDGTHKFLEEGSRTHKFLRSYVLSFVHGAISMGSVG